MESVPGSLFYFEAFSSRETVSTPLENAINAASGSAEDMQQMAAAAAESGSRPRGAAGQPSPAVSLSDVAIAFRLADGGTYRAVESIAFDVADGEFVAIVGPTGCGKTTLLNAAAGLFPPSEGRVDIYGAPLAGLNVQSGYLFQSEALFPWKTALENVAIGLECAGTPVREARERAHD
jgi:NitT/TauT family transport system ATP-binding protein